MPRQRTYHKQFILFVIILVVGVIVFAYSNSISDIAGEARKAVAEKRDSDGREKMLPAYDPEQWKKYQAESQSQRDSGSQGTRETSAEKTELETRESSSQPASKPGSRGASKPGAGRESPSDEVPDDDIFLADGLEFPDGASCKHDDQCESHLCVGVNTPEGVNGYCLPCETTSYSCDDNVCQLLNEQQALFYCDDGEDGNDGYICNQEHNCVTDETYTGEILPAYDESKKNQRQSKPIIELTEDLKKFYKACVQEMCVDTEGAPDPSISGSVFVRKKATKQDFDNSNTIILTNNGEVYQKETSFDPNKEFYVCNQYQDYCKTISGGSQLIEQTCGFQPTEQFGVLKVLKTMPPINCACGCLDGMCLPEPCPEKLPDLVVKDIHDSPYQNMCISSLTYEICNHGTAPLIQEFSMLVSANNKESLFPFSFAQYPELNGKLDPNQCVVVQNQNKLSFETFKIEYDKMYDVAVTLDLQNVVNELDETNNGQQKSIFAGPAYFDGNQYCYCGCDAVTGSCSECAKYPDLVIEQIYGKAHGEYCVNSYSFRLCNYGEKPVTESFTITGSANGVTSVFEFNYADYPQLQGSINPGQCVDVLKPNKLNIIKFKAALGESAEVTISVDTDGQLEEIDETNNIKTGSVYSGDYYYYDGVEACNVWCYDSDDGKDIWHYGEMIYKYNDVVFDENYNDPDQIPSLVNKDLCIGENKVELAERSCVEKINKYKNTDNFINPYQSEVINCRDLAKQTCAAEGKECGGKCDNGICVFLPKDFLSCIDYEEGQDPTFKGDIDYTDVDGNNEIIYDSCFNTEFVIDITCGKNDMKQSDWINCYRLKTPQGKGHVCEDGKCVVTDIDNEDCIAQYTSQTQPPEDPYADLPAILEIKLLGEKNWHSNYCSSWNDKIQLVYCNGKYPDWKEYDCKADGALCVPTENGAKCSYGDEKLKSCNEEGDYGLDYEQKGEIHYTNEYGLKDDKKDTCKNDDILIEYYCEGNQNYMSEYSCKDQGMVCDKISGTCKQPNDELQQCSDGDQLEAKPLEVFSIVTSTDKFGNNLKGKDCCVNPNDPNGCDQEGDLIKEYSCKENIMEQQNIPCEAGMGCWEGACVPKKKEWEKCESIAGTNNVWYTDQYGQSDYEGPNCDGFSIEIPVCNGNKLKSDNKPCPANTACNGQTVTCQSYSYDNEKCEVKQDGVMYFTDKFGQTQDFSPACDSELTIRNPICKGNTNWDWDYVDCGENQHCVYVDDKPQCVNADPSKMQCDDQEQGKNIYQNALIKSTDTYGSKSWNDDYCEDPEHPGQYLNYEKAVLGISNSVIEYYCDGNALKKETIPCNKNEACLNGICQLLQPELQMCSPDSSYGKDAIKFVNIFGVEDHNLPYCVDDEILKVPYCDGKNQNFKKITCEKGTGCNWKTDACEPYDLSKEKCESYGDYGYKITNKFGNVYSNPGFCLDDTHVNKLTCTNVFGDIFNSQVSCPEGSFCKEENIATEATQACPAGQVCEQPELKEPWVACLYPDESKKTCKVITEKK